MIYKSSVLKRAAAGLAMVMLAASALFAASDSPAHAKESQNIKFTFTPLAHVTETGDQVPAPGRQLTVDDYFYLGVEYDATKASPKAGDIHQRAAGPLRQPRLQQRPAQRSQAAGIPLPGWFGRYGC